MMVVVAAHIRAVIIAEGKDSSRRGGLPGHSSRESRFTRYARAFPPALFTSSTRSSRGDAQQDSLSGILAAVSGKDLIHGAVVLHHVNAQLIPFQGKVFLDLIRFRTASIALALRLIGKLDAAHDAVQFL